jgi:hypothetical protein
MSKRTSKPYSDKFKKRALELKEFDGLKGKALLARLQQEFPGYAKRLTTDRIYAAITWYKKKHPSWPAAVPAAVNAATQLATPKSKQRSQVKNGNSKKSRDLLIVEARKLRAKNYTWGAIVDELRIKFPQLHIPQPGKLAYMVKTGNSRGSPDKQGITEIILRPPNGIELTFKIPHRKLDKVVKMLLEA